MIFYIISKLFSNNLIRKIVNLISILLSFLFPFSILNNVKLDVQKTNKNADNYQTQLNEMKRQYDEIKNIFSLEQQEKEKYVS